MNDSVPARTTRSVPATGRLVSLHDGREYPFAVAPFVVGRDPGAAVVVGSPDAEPRHAEIVSRPDGDVLVDHSETGTYVNGQRVDGRLGLSALDVIRVGAEEFRYYPSVAISPEGPPPGATYRLADTLVGFPSLQSPPPSLSQAKPLATMLIKSGPAKGERMAVWQQVVSIGRGEFNEVRLADPSISVRHAKLHLREGVWTLTDLGSTNGTVVDGVPVTDEAALSPGAIVAFGDVSLSFEPLDHAPMAGPRAAAGPGVAAEPEAPAEPLDPIVPTAAPDAHQRDVSAIRPAVESPSQAVGVDTPPEPVQGSFTPAEPVAELRRGNPAILVGAILVLLSALAALVYLV